MKKIRILITISAIIALTLIVLLLNSNKLIQNSPKLNGNEIESCKAIFNSGNDKMNIVFLSSQKEAEQYSNSLFNIEPFKTNKNNFNVFYIDEYTPKCELYQSIALLCYSKEIIRKASSCPNDFIIVLDFQPVSIRSSSFINVLSINKNHPKTVLAHEFAHSLANLA